MLHLTMSLTVLVSLVSSKKEIITPRELQTSPLSMLFSIGANDLNERPTCWRRAGETGADAGPGCQVRGV